MNEESSGFGFVTVKNYEQAMAVLKRLFDVATPASIYSAPIVAGDRTIITASEVTVGMGLGVGAGADQQGNGGGGGGGGGGSFARPVAVIAIGPHGVNVEPVVDVTKIALALFTAVGAMMIAGRRMRRASRGKA
jgi:uncharacterized spore protein YtfJ